MKKILGIILSLSFVLTALTPRVRALSTSASSAILIDAESGRVLYAQNADEQRFIASITKLMTALVALESGHAPNETVTIKREYTGIEGSSMYLQTGEKLSLEALLYGLMLASGNDAAVAIADYCAGSVEQFVEQMNRKAAILGMEHTHFCNPNGLTEEGHYSTASDMAKLAVACMNNATIARIVGTKSISIGGRSFTNHNKMLWRYDGCIGMKTGYTQLSGRTLITCAERDGQRLIVVTLNDPNDWADHTALLDHGFAAYTRTQLSYAGATRTRIPVKGSLLSFVTVKAAADLYYPLAEGESVREEVSLTQWLLAPIEQGQTAGTVTYYLGDEVIGICPLIYGNSAAHHVVQGRGLLQSILDMFLF